VCSTTWWYIYSFSLSILTPAPDYNYLQYAAIYSQVAISLLCSSWIVVSCFSIPYFCFFNSKFSFIKSFFSVSITRSRPGVAALSCRTELVCLILLTVYFIDSSSFSSFNVRRYCYSDLIFSYNYLLSSLNTTFSLVRYLDWSMVLHSLEIALINWANLTYSLTVFSFITPILSQILSSVSPICSNRIRCRRVFIRSTCISIQALLSDALIESSCYIFTLLGSLNTDGDIMLSFFKNSLICSWFSSI
jgi:hypothetical protein